MGRLRSWVPAILLGSAIGPAADEEIAHPPPLSIALLDFEDRAGFQGRWNLARDVPEFLGRQLDEEEAFDVVSPEKVVEAREDPRLEGLEDRDLALAAGVQVSGVSNRVRDSWITLSAAEPGRSDLAAEAGIVVGAGVSGAYPLARPVADLELSGNRIDGAGGLSTAAGILIALTVGLSSARCMRC